MKKIALLFCLLLAAFAEAQTDDIVTIADQMPVFPGGDKAKAEFIRKNLQYPGIEKEYGVQGVAYVTFIVEKDGSITDVKCIRPVKNAPNLNREAVRLVKAMPKWQPGLQRNKPIRVQYILPIRFTLSTKPLSDEQMQAIAAAHYKKGVDYITAKKYKEALHELDYTIFYLPTDVNTLYQRGLAFHGLKDDKSACDQWSQVKFLGDGKADEVISKYCK